MQLKRLAINITNLIKSIKNYIISMQNNIKKIIILSYYIYYKAADYNSPHEQFI